MKTNKHTLNIVLATGCVALFSGWLVTRSRAGAEAAIPKAGWQQDAEYQRLLREREDSASTLLQIERRKLNDGKSTSEAVYLAASRLRDARLDRAAQPEPVIRAGHLALMREMEKSYNEKVGFPSPTIEELVRYWRLSAEIDLFRAQKEIGGR